MEGVTLLLSYIWPLYIPPSSHFFSASHAPVLRLVHNLGMERIMTTAYFSTTVAIKFRTATAAIILIGNHCQ